MSSDVVEPHVATRSLVGRCLHRLYLHSSEWGRGFAGKRGWEVVPGCGMPLYHYGDTSRGVTDALVDA